MDFRETVMQIAQVCGWTIREDADGLVIDVPTGGGRAQLVAITEERDIADQRVARYWSMIGDAERVDHAKCLAENARLCHGSFAIKGNKLCLVQTQLVATVDPAAVGAIIGNLAANADRYERELFGTDDY
jgi:hypothetical protein